MDRIWRREGLLPLAGRLRHAADCGTPDEAGRAGPRERARTRALRDVAHRLRPHWRSPAVPARGQAGPALSRRLVQRLASYIRPAGVATRGDVFDRDPGSRSALERLAR